LERSTKWRSHLTSPFFRVTVVTVTLFPRGYPLGILASDRRSLTKHPLRNLLLIFGGWELCSRPPKMSKGTERDQEKFFSRGLPSQIQHSTNKNRQYLHKSTVCFFVYLFIRSPLLPLPQPEHPLEAPLLLHMNVQALR